jgi:hypothetical protein
MATDSERASDFGAVGLASRIACADEGNYGAASFYNRRQEIPVRCCVATAAVERFCDLFRLSICWFHRQRSRQMSPHTTC